MATVEKIIIYAFGEHDPGSVQDWRRSSEIWSPGPGSAQDWRTPSDFWRSKEAESKIIHHEHKYE